ESAVKHFQNAYTFNPDERTRYNLSLAYANLAKFYVSIGKFEDAINYYLMTEDAGLITPAILNNHAIALAISGDELEAMMIFESALNLAPEDKTILTNISRLTSRTAPDFVTNDIATEFSPIPPMKAAEPSITI
ncbi:MAG TPA: hypothetical protein VKC34_01055, partial [Blastocatellia bacterium]|nr:hypothetical protein [Blastocatellia bacterium]